MQLLTKKQAAEKLKISKRTIERWAKKGILKPLKASEDTRTVRDIESEVDNVFRRG